MFRLFQSAKPTVDTRKPATRREPQLPPLVTALPARGPVLQPAPLQAPRRSR